MNGADIGQIQRLGIAADEAQDGGIGIDQSCVRCTAGERLERQGSGAAAKVQHVGVEEDRAAVFAETTMGQAIE